MCLRRTPDSAQVGLDKARRPGGFGIRAAKGQSERGTIWETFPAFGFDPKLKTQSTRVLLQTLEAD
jgi:hypothetical protein